MPSRPLSQDRQLEVLLSAMIFRAGHNANARSAEEDVAEIVANAGQRTDLLSEAVGLNTLGWSTSAVDRKRELAPLFAALDLPDVDRWYAVAEERAMKSGSHTADGISPRDVPGIGKVRPGHLPGL